MRKFLASVLVTVALFVMTMPAIGAGSVAPVAKIERVQKAPAKKARKTSVYVFCGLFSFDVCGLGGVAQKARAAGMNAEVYSHWADPYLVSADARKRGDTIVYVGHSAGADKALGSKGSSKTFAVDPTVFNPGARKGVVTEVYYNPFNRIPLVICCGGAAAVGANNVRWPKPHIAMGSDPALQARIMSQIRNSKRR